MTQYDALKAIYQQWMNQWPGLSSNVPYVFDDDAIDETQTFARVSVTSLGSDQQTIGKPGSRRFLRSGLIDVKLVGDGASGRKQLDQLVPFVQTIFEGARFGGVGTEDGIVCYATSVGELVRQSTAHDWVLLCSTPYEFFEVR